MIKLMLVSTLLGLANAECPNACSSHGKCTAYDMCLCYRNWMSNDCSERVCQFGLAHVDTPKGDLDSSSGELSGPDDNIINDSEVYPFGTTEQFPAMKNSDDTVVSESAHYYMECSNKGLCDRENGVCECFPGYEGSACQRASCPSNSNGVCSGHGTCESIKDIAKRDHNNVYELWDEHSSMGCVCDPGYYGPDCSLRECKYGADPLYYDDNANIRYSNWTYVLATAPGSSTTLSGTYSIIFYDHHGEDWETDPLPHDATCADIVTALENIPNDVVPDGSVRCYKYMSGDDDNFYTQFSSTSPVIHHKYTIMFPQNPGYLKEIRLNKYLDGYRPTLETAESDSTLQLFVYANGFIGEDVDVVPDECENVKVSFSSLSGYLDSGSIYYLELSDEEVPLLKRCLGDADNRLNFANQADEIYQWDHGSAQNPHLVKFIQATEKLESIFCHSRNDSAYVDPAHLPGWCFEHAPAGFYAPVIYDESEEKFFVYSNAPVDYASTIEFRVFTTKGYLNRVARDSEAFTELPSDDWESYHSNVVYTYNNGNNALLTTVFGAHPVSTTYRSQSEWTGNVDCETTTVRDIYNEDCLQKGDYVMFFSVEDTAANYNINPKYHNIYKIEKIARELPDVDTPGTAVEDPYRNQITLNAHVNFRYRYDTTNAVSGVTRARAYKFYPPTTEVRYVDQCSGRGLCNAQEGLCECFTGYTYDDCSVQNSAAK